MQHYANLIRMIQNLYDKANSAVYLNNSTGDWIRTTVGVRQGCVLSPTFFNIFLERIMADALDDHEGTVGIGGRTIMNLRFADAIEAGRDKTSTAFGMQINAKLMTNNTNGISTYIMINSEKIDCVNSFKYLGAIIADEGSKPVLLNPKSCVAKLIIIISPINNDLCWINAF